jgi:hypothetical protein
LRGQQTASLRLCRRYMTWSWCRAFFRRAAKSYQKKKVSRLSNQGRSYLQFTNREGTNEPNRQVAASVGVAILAEPSMHGYLSEHHSCGETAFFLAEAVASVSRDTIGRHARVLRRLVVLPKDEHNSVQIEKDHRTRRFTLAARFTCV